MVMMVDPLRQNDTGVQTGWIHLITCIDIRASSHFCYLNILASRHFHSKCVSFPEIL